MRVKCGGALLNPLIMKWFLVATEPGVANTFEVKTASHNLERILYYRSSHILKGSTDVGINERA